MNKPVSMQRLIFILLAFTPLMSFSQTVEEVIRQHITALGGQEKIKAIKTISLQGTMLQNETAISINTTIIPGRAIKTHATAPGGEMIAINCYKAGRGWKISPLSGTNGATDLADKEREELKADATASNELVDHPETGSSIELMGEDIVNSIKAWKIKLTRTSGGVAYYYIGKEDKLLLKRSTSVTVNSISYDIDVLYSDYRFVQGVKFPFKKIQSTDDLNLITTYDTITLDIPVDERIFEKGSTE